MYRTVNDFLADWSAASAGTVQVLESLTNETLEQAIVEDHNTLGWLGWHLTHAIPYFAGMIGLELNAPGDPKFVPSEAVRIVSAYEQVSDELKSAVERELSDDKLLETVDNYGQQTPRGVLLRVMIDHQTHHRGQMTVLLRQAGLKVPSIMGPTKEDGVTY